MSFMEQRRIWIYRQRLNGQKQESRGCRAKRGIAGVCGIAEAREARPKQNRRPIGPPV
jgi:hypothetical protein